MYIIPLSYNNATESIERQFDRCQINSIYNNTRHISSNYSELLSYPCAKSNAGEIIIQNEAFHTSINYTPVIMPYTADEVKLNKISCFNFLSMRNSFDLQFKENGEIPDENTLECFTRMAMAFYNFPIIDSCIDYSFYNKAINFQLLFKDDVLLSVRKEVEENDDLVSFSISYKDQLVYVDTEELYTLKKHLENFLNKLNLNV